MGGGFWWMVVDGGGFLHGFPEVFFDKRGDMW